MDDKDFIDVSDVVETLSLDDEVSNEIDSLLDNIMPEEKKPNVIEDILNNDEKDNKKKLDVYVPSKKNFNIKSAKTHKIVKKVMIYSIIFILFTFEFFLNKANNTLNNLKVYASNNNPIMIIQNSKYGFIDEDGNKIVNPKYNYAEEYVKGYTIVKDVSNLPLVIDKAGKEVIKTGKYFTLYRAGEDVIASKTTSKGLKYGILTFNFDNKTEFEYDLISYHNDVFTFVKKNIVGVFNKEGKEIYTLKLTDSDEKVISVEPSNVNSDNTIYGVVKVNGSNLIINLDTGKVAYGPTVNNVVSMDNNVFYELKEGKKEYLYIQNDDVVVDSLNYESLSMYSINAGVLKALKSDFTYEYISNNTKEQVNKKLSSNDVFFGENVFIYKSYNYKKGKIGFNLVKDGVKYKELFDIKGIKSPFKNGFAIVEYNDGKYGYINEDGEFLNDIHYVELHPFDTYGDAIVKTERGYGVLNKKNKKILDAKYKKIKMATSSYKKNTYSDDNTIFYAVMVGNEYVLFNKNGKRINNRSYMNVSFNDTYGVVKVTDIDTKLLLSESLNEIDFEEINQTYKAFNDYIKINNKLYNYEGKLIYVDKKEGE